VFLEFLDLEFDPEKKELYIAARYTPTHRHPDIKDWDFYRYDQLPPMPKQQRVALERMFILLLQATAFE
jgi:hypothetical protein